MTACGAADGDVVQSSDKYQLLRDANAGPFQRSLIKTTKIPFGVILQDNSDTLISKAMHLKWGLRTARVLLSAESVQFDPVSIKHWREEGFTVSYLAFNGNAKEYAASLRSIAEPLGFGEEFALIGKISLRYV